MVASSQNASTQTRTCNLRQQVTEVSAGWRRTAVTVRTVTTRTKSKSLETKCFRQPLRSGTVWHLACFLGKRVFEFHSYWQNYRFAG